MAKVAPSSENTKRKPTKISCDLRLDVDDNILISYADIGPRNSNDVVLLLHAFMSNSDNTWGSGGSGVCDALVDAGYRCILVDLRGHGGSSKPYDPSKYGVCVTEDLLKLLDHLKLAQVHMLGYSMGSEVAMYFTIHHQDRVKSLCIGGSGWSDSEQADMYKTMGKCCGKLPGALLCWMRAVWYPCCCPCCCYCLGGYVPDLKAGVACAKAHGEQIVDLPEEKVKKITVPMFGAAGEKDPEIKYLQKMEGVVERYEFASGGGFGHDGFATSSQWKETILKFLDKQRAGERTRGEGGVVVVAPPQEAMRN